MIWLKGKEINMSINRLTDLQLVYLQDIRLCRAKNFFELNEGKIHQQVIFVGP